MRATFCPYLETASCPSPPLRPRIRRSRSPAPFGRPGAARHRDRAGMTISARLNLVALAVAAIAVALIGGVSLHTVRALIDATYASLAL